MGKTKTAFVGEEIEGAKKPLGKARGKEKPDLPAGKAGKVHIAGLKGGQRIKAIEVEPVVEEQAAEKAEEQEKKKKAPKVRGKSYLEAKKKVNPANVYPLPEAIALVKTTSYSKFDGSVEAHLVLKKTGISAQVTLPHSGGKEKKIEIASEETIKKLTSGKIDFDVLLATAEMMPKLVPFARILGPRGLMPNPKSGTLLTDIKKAKSFSANSLSLKTEKEAPLVHAVVGKVSQPDKELIENAQAIFAALGGAKQIVRAFVKATMGPSIKIAIS